MLTDIAIFCAATAATLLWDFATVCFDMDEPKVGWLSVVWSGMLGGCIIYLVV